MAQLFGRSAAKSPFPSEDIDSVMQRLEFARNILQEHGNYAWLTERGSFVISNNGIEWSITYFVMFFVVLRTSLDRHV